MKQHVGSPKERPELADAGLALLSFASGSMDALAFFKLGEVFPSAMTGNTALLGLALGQGHLTAASRPFVAFAGFLTGAAVASAAVELWFRDLPISRAVWRLLALEVCLLALFAFAWWFVDRSIAGDALYGLIIAASSAMGIQSVAARLVGRNGISTVVFTSTLTSIVTTATQAMLRPSQGLPVGVTTQIGMFLTYGVGAGLCGLLALHAPPMAVAALPLLAVVGAAGFHWGAGKRNSGT